MIHQCLFICYYCCLGSTRRLHETACFFVCLRLGTCGRLNLNCEISVSRPCFLSGSHDFSRPKDLAIEAFLFFWKCKMAEWIARCFPWLIGCSFYKDQCFEFLVILLSLFFLSRLKCFAYYFSTAIQTQLINHDYLRYSGQMLHPITPNLNKADGSGHFRF